MPRGAEIGSVIDTWVAPFKSMQGISLPELTLRSVSVQGDRRYGIVIHGEKTPNWLDSIRYPGLLKYKTRFLSPSSPAKSEVIVTAPDGQEYSATDPALLDRIGQECGERLNLSKAVGRELALVDVGRGLWHSMSVSLLGRPSISDIARQVPTLKLDSRRFRMNLLIDPSSDEPYEEDQWIGKQVKFKSSNTVLFVAKPDGRCRTVNFNPETGAEDLQVLRVIGQTRKNNLGVYCLPLIRGEAKITRGEQIRLSRM